jgi:hypothetical protein
MHEQTSDEQLHDIAELARQTNIPEVREELYDLADRLDRMGEVAKQIREI